MVDELTCKVQRHILTGRVFDIGWFPERLDHDEQSALEGAGFGASEVRVSGIAGRDDRYDMAQLLIKRAALRCLLFMDGGFMLFRTLSRYGTRNKLRTRNGVFSPDGTASRRLVTEFEREKDGQSIIGGILVVEESCFDKCWNWMADYQRSVILVAKEPLSTVPGRDLVEKVMGTLEGEQAVWIDYPKLVTLCSDIGYSVLRRGGDAGETFVNLTLFGSAEVQQQYEQQVEAGWHEAE